MRITFALLRLIHIIVFVPDVTFQIFKEKYYILWKSNQLDFPQLIYIYYIYNRFLFSSMNKNNFYHKKLNFRDYFRFSRTKVPKLGKRCLHIDAISLRKNFKFFMQIKFLFGSKLFKISVS